MRRYVHGPGVDEPLVWYEGTDGSAPRWLIADRPRRKAALALSWPRCARRRSIIATTNAGGVATTFGYGPYGEPQAWSGAGGALLSRFRYTGQAALPELGLYHYKARAYDPRLGRFLQTDPIGYEDDLNLYAYVGNDPLNAVDPSGHATVSCVENEDGSFTCTVTGSLVEIGVISLGVAAWNFGVGISKAVSGGGEGGDGRQLGRNDNEGPQSNEPRGPLPPIPPIPPATDHGQQRRDQAAAGDAQSQVGDPNRVIREGRVFHDTATGNTVHVSGNRVVVTNSQGQLVTQWSDQTRANTQMRIQSGRWMPQ